MNAPAHLPLATAAATSLLHDLAQTAINASLTLTAASIAGPAVSDALYAHIENAADRSRRHLLQHLKNEHGIDAATAEQLGALL